jgi:hypothetical protein
MCFLLPGNMCTPVDTLRAPRRYDVDAVFTNEGVQHPRVKLSWERYLQFSGRIERNMSSDDGLYVHPSPSTMMTMWWYLQKKEGVQHPREAFLGNILTKQRPVRKECASKEIFVL